MTEQVERIRVIARRGQFGQEPVPIVQRGRQPMHEQDR
jgi:hypothetical protein